MALEVVLVLKVVVALCIVFLSFLIYTFFSLHIQASDQDVSVIAIATMANILSFSDTMLLTDAPTVESLGVAMAPLMDVLRTSQLRPQRFYAAAAIANATAHPRLAEIIKHNGGEELLCL